MHPLRILVLEALNMEDMMTAVHKCIKHPNEAETSNRMGKVFQRKSEDGIYFLIIEGFLLYSYKPLSSVFTRRYFLTVPYEECKKRRSSRVYVPPDPPGYFDGHVWPMYLKHKDEMEETEREIVYLDGTKLEDDIFSLVYEDVRKSAQECSI
uniref:Nicotinamide riboside kinase 1 n=1 Tax=Leptobrachium leishanense TaxID=445787 RepID=A0A8C5N208_9ANUR